MSAGLHRIQPPVFKPPVTSDLCIECTGTTMAVITTTATTTTQATTITTVTPTSSSFRPPPAAALTTIWTAPCGLDRWWRDVPERCQPPDFSAYFTGRVSYYSPAICPSGFSPSCERFNSVQGPELLPGETARLCVQSGYHCLTSTDPFYAHSVSGMSSLIAPYIQIRWQESDLSKFETPPLSDLGGGSSMASASPTPLSYAGPLTGGPSPPGASIMDVGSTSGALTSPETVGSGGPSNGTTTSNPGGSTTKPPAPPAVTAHPSGQGASHITSGAKGAIAGSISVVGILLCVAAVFFLRRYRASSRVKQRSGEEGQGVFELSGESPPTPAPAPVPAEKTPAVAEADVAADTKLLPLEDNISPISQSLLVTDQSHIHPLLRDQVSPLLEKPATPAAASADDGKEKPGLLERSGGVLGGGRMALALPPDYSPLRRTASSPAHPELTTALDGLRAKQAELEAERRRILRLQEIEAEQARLRVQMAEFEVEG